MTLSKRTHIHGTCSTCKRRTVVPMDWKKGTSVLSGNAFTAGVAIYAPHVVCSECDTPLEDTTLHNSHR